jgi:hypothetical protein
LFYFNELRLEHNTVERKMNRTSISDEKIKKGDCFMKTESIFRNSSPVSDTLYQEGIKNHPNNRPKLNQRESASHDDEFLEWFKEPSCEEVEVLHQDVYSMGKWIEEVT